MRISALSLEYVRVRVAATEAGAAVNPTSDTVVMAFVAEGAAPAGGDWKTAGWETDTTTNPDTYYARCLVGPSGAVTLTAGVYDVWVKVTDTPEAPVLRAGNVEVF
ncbi:MAG: hypothetical protein IT340_21495 [Chloroflexi bacterium]|nr:hypothetical protein [Chloroflexota bacterium]